MAEKQTKRTVFLEGFRDGIPIALGYFAVAFSLGIAARNAGLTAFQGFIASTLCVASAGEYALFTMIGAGAMSQKIDPQMPNAHRYLFGAGVTDEIFAITIARPGRLEPMYNYGAMAVSVPAWAVGTALGIIMGNLLPARAVSALSVALYGMFLAIIIPPMKKNLAIALCVIAGFASSWAAGAYLPLSAGTRTIVLTVGLSSLAALLFPREEESGDA